MEDKRDKNMETITLQEIDTRIERNYSNNKNAIELFDKQLSERKDLKRGRIRPRDPVEAKILSRFKPKWGCNEIQKVEIDDNDSYVYVISL